MEGVCDGVLVGDGPGTGPLGWTRGLEAWTKTEPVSPDSGGRTEGRCKSKVPVDEPRDTQKRRYGPVVPVRKARGMVGPVPTVDTCHLPPTLPSPLQGSIGFVDVKSQPITPTDRIHGRSACGDRSLEAVEERPRGVGG